LLQQICKYFCETFAWSTKELFHAQGDDPTAGLGFAGEETPRQQLIVEIKLIVIISN